MSPSKKLDIVGAFIELSQEVLACHVPAYHGEEA
jgi:hypothetical protein|tara:strand:- start:16600 stop:16701 length:102 start_codon:yes stop_codon:yes gene_type:complete